jgi:predicted DNA-binding helix-hairpin-helix protein
MIVGASPDSDARIIRLSQGLYDHFKLKRVYYSSYVPVNTDNSLLPVVPSDLRREHRLYEADFLMRLYGFKAEELLPDDRNLSLEMDVKSDWAVRNFQNFPLEINKASYEMLLRVPGIGVRNAYRIAEARRHGNLDYDALKKMRVVLRRAKYFITIGGKFYGGSDNPERIKNILLGQERLLNSPQKAVQMSFFDTLPSYISGEF